MLLVVLLVVVVVVGLAWQGVSTIMTVGVMPLKALAQPRYQGLRVPHSDG